MNLRLYIVDACDIGKKICYLQCWFTRTGMDELCRQKMLTTKGLFVVEKALFDKC